MSCMKLSNANPVDVFDGGTGDKSEDFSRHYRSNGASRQEFSLNNIVAPFPKRLSRRPFSFSQLHGLANHIEAASDTALAKFLLELVCHLLAPDEQRFRHLYKVLLSAFQHHGALLNGNSIFSEFERESSFASAASSRRVLYDLIIQEVGATGLRLPDAAFLASNRLTHPSSSLKKGLGPNGSFVFLDKLGSGAFGRVLKVRSLHDNREYALKEVVLDVGVGADKAKRHLREVENLAKLDHPHVVRYFSCWFERMEARTLFIDQLDSHSKASTSPLESADVSISSRETDSCVVFERSAFDKTTNNNKMKKKMSSDRSLENSDCHKKMARRGQTRKRRSEFGWLYKLCIQMQYCQDTLAHWLFRRNNAIHSSTLCSTFDVVRPAQNALIVGQLFQGVAYLQENNIIHRDLKPANIFFETMATDRPRVRIGDFGLSRLWKNDAAIGNEAADLTVEQFNDLSVLDCKTRLTGTQGTLLYMSPEMEKGEQYGPETDIYSLGIVMYELYHPFGTQYERVICLQQLRECGGRYLPESARELAHRWPVEVQLITDMVSELASARPTAAQLVQRYLRWLTSNTEADAIPQKLSLREEALLRLLEQRDSRICELEAEIQKLKSLNLTIDSDPAFASQLKRS